MPSYYRPLEGKDWEGFNFKTMKNEDMYEAGVIDSVNVSKNALIDSVSLAIMLIDIEVAVVRASKNVDSMDYNALSNLNRI